MKLTYIVATSLTLLALATGASAQSVTSSSAGQAQAPAADRMMIPPVSQRPVCAPGMGSMSLGSRSENVRVLQEYLQRQGFFTGTPSGYYGAQTVRAVSRWQGSVGLPRTGVYGARSRAQMAQICYDDASGSIPGYNPDEPVTKPVACTKEYNPVCARPAGCQDTCKGKEVCTMLCKLYDPKTYGNACMAKAAQAQILHTGACTPESKNQF